MTIFSAHGVAKRVEQWAADRGLPVIDATCPLVAKVHSEARRFAAQGYDILLIGHEGHEEVVGTSGESPEHITIVDGPDAAARLEPENPERLAWLSQTTLSVDDTRDVIDALRRKFPKIVGPSRDDICYATQNRQAAVKTVAGDVDVLLVIGAANSSNSIRLVEVSQSTGTRAYLINDIRDVRREWLEGAKRIGVTAGASAPEVLVTEVVEALRNGGATVREVKVGEENVRFALPPELEQMARERGTTLPSRPVMRQSI